MTDRIEIRGLTTLGIHGVRDFEKERPQPFVVDLLIEADLTRAGRSDELDDTLSYSDVATEVAQIIEGEHSDLLEHLAQRIADAVLAHEQATAVEVTVRKPNVLLSVPVTDVGVTILRP